MMKSFSLKWLLTAVALLALLIALTQSMALQGLMFFASLLLAGIIFFTPNGPPPYQRWLIVLMAVGAAISSWCVLKGMFGSQTIGQVWYRGQLNEIGGWSAGIFVGAWRASHLFFQNAAVCSPTRNGAPDEQSAKLGTNDQTESI